MSRVLIIDDDEVIANALFRHLIDSGVAADLALDARIADALLSAHDYAVVLMDLYLTGQVHKKPIELLELVHRRRPAAQIILLTAYGSRALAERLLGNEKITVVAKPQPVPFLADMIAGFLKGSEARVS